MYILVRKKLRKEKFFIITCTLYLSISKTIHEHAEFQKSSLLDVDNDEINTHLSILSIFFFIYFPLVSFRTVLHLCYDSVIHRVYDNIHSITK